MPASAALTIPSSAPFATGDIARLNDVFANSTAEQRAWLAGFLAGVQAANSDGRQLAPAAAPSAKPAAAEPLTILYGTESGNSERLAANAQKAARKGGFKPRLLDMADASPAELAGAKNLLVIASTWGEGEPPQRAELFYRALLGDQAPKLENVRFAVLALGDSSYANFCETGRVIDERLAALGATRGADRVELDLDFEAGAADWTKRVLETFAPKPNGAADARAGSVIHVDFAGAEAVRPEDEAPTWSRANPYAAEIQAHVNLSGSRSSKEVVHLELSLDGAGLAYEPGDALSIVPENDPQTVEAVLAAAKIRPTPELERRLARELDVTTLSRPLLEALHKARPQKKLAKLLANDAWRSWLPGRQLVDVLEAFPSELSADELTGLLRQIPARAYSISSSPLAYPDEAHLLVGAVRYTSHDRGRQGVASTWVADRLAVGKSVPAFLRPNKHFRLPADGDVPLIMVGPGTGVAPFRAFLQHRREQGAKGRNWLIFGDRSYTQDFLYQLDWQELENDGVLTRMDVAFSRDQPEKIYVQHRLWEHRAELWRWLEEGARLYLCGDASAMAKDVHAMLLEIAADRGVKEPAAWADELVRSGRYLRDTY